MNCIHCGKRTTNPKYCSKSCSASCTNKQYPRRKPEGSCSGCGCRIPSKNNYCYLCKPTLTDLTLQEAIYHKHHRSSAFALVRSRARAIAKKLNMTKCINCGYNKHVEIAHVRPISSYPLHTRVSDINKPEMLMPLCPNCHWEFDNGLLAPLAGLEPASIQLRYTEVETRDDTGATYLS